jgi:hypothetical protein
MLDDAQHVLDLLIGRSGRALPGAIECVAIDFAQGGRVADNRLLQSRRTTAACSSMASLI